MPKYIRDTIPKQQETPVLLFWYRYVLLFPARHTTFVAASVPQQQTLITQNQNRSKHVEHAVTMEKPKCPGAQIRPCCIRAKA